MKKAVPFFIGGIVLLLLSFILLSSKGKPQRQFDDRITLRQRDKIPYGTSAAVSLLPSLFPEATVVVDKRSPGDWDSVDISGSGQAVILLSDYFDADEGELKTLGNFVAKGNYVFIIARTASDAVPDYFNLSFTSPYSNYSINEHNDSLRVKLLPPAFSTDSFFVYPGRRFESDFYATDTGRTMFLGNSEDGKPNFIRMDKGEGSFFIHSVPLAFSNYFVLHKNNNTYYAMTMSVIPKNVHTVLWNEYYLSKPHTDNDTKEPNWLSALFQYPAFKWGLLAALFTLVLFILLGMRRRQRMIPVYQKPANDSLDFVKTLGRLYYDKKDHLNLAHKMAAYFLEHVRTVYKLPTHTLDDHFVQALYQKSGYAEAETKALVDSLKNLKERDAFSEKELAAFHKSLELFYQNT